MESINTPKLDTHYYLFIGHILFITSHSYDAVLCLMMVLDYMWKHLLIRFLLLLCLRRCVLAPPYRITMKTRIPNCFIRVVLLSLRSFRLVYHQVQMKAVLFPDVCVCEGSVGHESSSEELEGDRDRSAGHSGGLFSHHLVSDPPHSRYCSKHSFMFTNIHFWDGKVSFNEKGILLKPHVVNHGILTRLISLNHLYSSFI